MKNLFLSMMSAAIVIAGCGKDDGGNDGSFIPPVEEQLEQSAYADNETTGEGFSFTADAPWTATVTEVQAPAAASPASATRAAAGDGNNVVWLKLYVGNDEAYSGGAGTVSLRIEIDQNYTGERREAEITIRSGDNTFTVTVVQEANKQDGSPNEAPVKVTEIALDNTRLWLEAGEKATLTATVKPDDATIKSVAWSSSNPAVASVNPVTGEITAVADGTAVVTATSSSNKEVSASCTVAVGEDDPDVPSGKKLISHMENTYWYPYGSAVEEDGREEVDFFYDDQSRLTKMVLKTYSETAEPSPASVRRRFPVAPAASSASTRAMVPVTITLDLAYGDGSVSYRISREENGVTDTHYDTGKAYLNEAGYVVSGESTSYDNYNDEWIPYSDTYELTYDDEGRLVKSVSEENGEERITWSGGNPTEVWWGMLDDGQDIIDKASYGTVPNKTNLDLNWFCALSTEGWAFASGDGNNIFPLIGLTGVRSTHIAEYVTQSEFSGSHASYRYTYETDADGLPTKITEEEHNSYSEPYKSLEIVITYTE